MAKKIYLISITIVIIILLVSIFLNKDSKVSILEYFSENKISSFILKDRYILDTENGVSIGKNRNELENGYYDVKINVDEYVNISINKLFKDFDINILYDEKYIDEIIEYIVLSTNLNLNKEEFKKSIIDNYAILRDIDRNEDKIDKVTINNNINIKIYEENNILILKIGDKND